MFTFFMARLVNYQNAQDGVIVDKNTQSRRIVFVNARKYELNCKTKKGITCSSKQAEYSQASAK